MAISRNLDLKQYFTDAEHVNTLMCQLLGPVDGLDVLEPSVGYGALLKGLMGVPRSVHAVDVDCSALAAAKQNVLFDNVVLHHCDFIDIFADTLLSATHPVRKNQYDAVISNPPYGLYLDVRYRRQLKKTFPNLYVRESFGLFFVFAISLLRPNGKYVFLIPDTFLTSKNHTPLREFICLQAAPTHIIRFPSKKFETVNFGYGNLCIIAGQKRAVKPDDRVLWADSMGSGTEKIVSNVDDFESVEGEVLLKHIDSGWSSMGMAPSSDMSGWHTLGELAECRTGIYTGDNVRFIGYDPARVRRRLNGHPIEWNEQIYRGALSEEEKASGLTGTRYYVPLIRGGHRECFEEPASAIDWGTPAINFYKTDKKARFQNSKFYFSEGLSVPMVSTGRISAALMQGAVFDQGVVGIFPNDKRWISPLLVYLNSSLASKLMKGLVNGSANNSANYLKKLPVPAFNDEQIKEAIRLVDSARATLSLPTNVCDAFVEACSDVPTTASMLSD